MIRKIYHGSDKVVRSPRFGAGSAYNDFGLGFYCTDSKERAGQWATRRGQNGFVSRYLLETDGLTVIDLMSPRYTPLNWISVLLGYREFDTFTADAYRARDYIRTAFAVDYQGCDCMVGWRADDVTFSYVQDFLNGRIPYGCLCSALQECSNGRQFVLKSNRAFDKIIYDGYQAVSGAEVYPAAVAEELRAMKRYSAEIGNKVGNKADKTGELYIGQILEENIKPFDPRLK